MTGDPKHIEKQVEVDGVTVGYRVSGPDNGTMPIVLVHGTAGDIDRHFGFMFPMMAFRRKVIALNMADPGTEALELDQLVSQLRAVVDAEVPHGPMALLGNSLGSSVVARLAAQLGKERVPQLILLVGMVKPDTHIQLRIRLWKKLLELDERTCAEFMTLCAFSPFFMSTRTVEELTAGSAKVKITPFVEKQMDLNARIDITEDCDRIQSHTLVISCSDDFMISTRNQKALFGAIEPSCYTEIPSGHGVVIERSAEVFSHVDRFLKRPHLYPIGEIVYPQKP